MRLTARLCSRPATLIALAGAIVTLSAGVNARQAASEGAGNLDASHLAALHWRSIGPAITGGRTVEFAVVEVNPDIIYAATASGGAWKTTNGGTTWEPVFERERTVSLGAIALSQSNPSIIWVGTGEANSVRSSSWGDGVYKSEDGGRSWTHLGLEKSQHVGRILIHPENPDIVYVAALGALWGENEERGLFKTTNGGRTWTKTLYVSPYTGVVDVAMDPRDPDVLYAATFQRERRYYSFLGGGPEGGVFKSVNGGNDWMKLTGSLPKGPVGRIGLAVCRSQPDTLYAAIVAPNGGIFRSDDRGASWERRTPEVSTHWYYGQIVCDPKNPDRLYVPQTRFHLSEDGGRTFRSDFATPNVHGDYHTIWIDPNDTDHMALGTDGGIYLSRDGGRTWEFMDQLSIAQFYSVAVDMQEPFYYVYGGTQDNSSWGGPSGTRYADGITNADWYLTVGGDGFYAQIDPTDPTVVYSESQYGNLFRFDTRTGERQHIQPQPPSSQKYRWNWSAPVLISPHNPQTLYFAANVLFKSTDRGDSWQVISPDLTRQIDEFTLPLQGKVWDRDAIDLHASTADYGNITTIAESPIRRGLLVVGTDDGLVQVSRDDGGQWAKSSGFPGVPEQTRVSRVVASRFAEGTIYATFDGHQDNDFKPYVLRSVDCGRSWKSIAANLPEFGSVHVIAEHPRNSSLLFVGTEFGVFFTIDGGVRWMELRNNLPTVAVHDLVIHPRDNDLVLGTHGRGFWILDDIGPLEALSPSVLDAESHLFNIRPAVQMHHFNRGGGSTGQQRFAAPNPPDGAIISYYSASTQSGQVDVLDSVGRLVRRLTGPRAAGIQRLVWDLREEPPGPVDSAGRARFGRGLRGPFVLPGNYLVRLRLGSEEHRQIAQVSPDPLVSMTDEDRRGWHDETIALGQLLETAQIALATAEHLQSRLRDIRAAVAAAPAAAAPLGEKTSTLARDVEALLTELRGQAEEGVARTPGPLAVVDQLRQLYSTVEAATARPTAEQRRVAREAHDRLSRVVTGLNRLTQSSIPALAGELDQAGVRWTEGRPIRLPAVTLPPPGR